MSVTNPFNAAALIGEKPLVMGVLNVTPDSFSDGGQHASVTSAFDYAQQMINEYTAAGISPDRVFAQSFQLEVD